MLLGTLDTKGVEYAYLTTASRADVDVAVVQAGILGWTLRWAQARHSANLERD